MAKKGQLAGIGSCNHWMELNGLKCNLLCVENFTRGCYNQVEAPTSPLEAIARRAKLNLAKMCSRIQRRLYTPAYVGMRSANGEMFPRRVALFGPVPFALPAIRGQP